MKKTQLIFMYLVIRFMVKFMLYGAKGMRGLQQVGTSDFANELIAFGDDLGKKVSNVK